MAFSLAISLRHGSNFMSVFGVNGPHAMQTLNGSTPSALTAGAGCKGGSYIAYQHNCGRQDNCCRTH